MGVDCYFYNNYIIKMPMKKVLPMSDDPLVVIPLQFDVMPDEKTKKLWEEFSKQCNEKYDEMVCMNKWMTFTPRENGLTIASIYHWLKQDNPESDGQGSSLT